MKSIIHPGLFLILLLSGIVARAQERTTIVDPEITFSYLLPEGYAYTDDPYYHFVYPAAGSKDLLPRLSLTYFDKTCPDLDDCFDGRLNGELRTAYKDFKINEKKNFILNSVHAIIATYTFSENGVPLSGMLCTFVKEDSYFVIEAHFLTSESTTYEPIFEGIVKSIQVIKR